MNLSVTPPQNETLSLSVVIANFNYAEFLADAIDSALHLDWPRVEVIVVDDGSTDASRAVMARYGERIVSILQDNGGQVAACNAGFARSRGEVVIFLDADDLLDASLMQELARVWRPGLSKVQFQMRIVDAAGRDQGSVLPQYDGVPSPEQIRSWVQETSAYPTPPGSGNAYSRAFLQQIFPLSGPDRASDSYCLAAAPYLGDVLTIPKPLVSYRVHGRNDGAMSALDVTRFGRELTRALDRFRYAQTIASSVGLELPDRAFDRSLQTLSYRLASWQLARETHPIAGDSRRRIIADALRAFASPQGLSRPARSALLLWLLLVASAPRPAGERLALWRFVAASRPAPLRRLLHGLSVVRRR